MERMTLVAGLLLAVTLVALLTGQAGTDVAFARGARPVGAADVVSPALNNPSTDRSRHLGVTDLEYDLHQVVDNGSGESDGNGDAEVDCGETVELYVGLYNPKASTVYVVTSTITATDPYVSGFGNRGSSYPSIAFDETEMNDDAFVFSVRPDVPSGHDVHFTLDITAEDGNSSVYFDVPVARHHEGDVNCSTCVDVEDVTAVAANWRCVLGEPCYDQLHDLDGSGTITVVDVMRVAAEWGWGCP